MYTRSYAKNYQHCAKNNWEVSSLRRVWCLNHKTGFRICHMYFGAVLFSRTKHVNVQTLLLYFMRHFYFYNTRSRDNIMCSIKSWNCDLFHLRNNLSFQQLYKSLDGIFLQEVITHATPHIFLYFLAYGVSIQAWQQRNTCKLHIRIPTSNTKCYKNNTHTR